MTREQSFKAGYATELLSIAEGDFETLEVLIESKKGRPENVCFIAQQVIEKSIKTVLISQGIAIPFTHNLEILLDRLDKSELPPESLVIPDLTEYASIRHEEAVIQLDRDDLESAFELARSTLNWAKVLVKGKMPS
jgi:HEPN domain-containing protein